MKTPYSPLYRVFFKNFEIDSQTELASKIYDHVSDRYKSKSSLQSTLSRVLNYKQEVDDKLKEAFIKALAPDEGSKKYKLLTEKIEEHNKRFTSPKYSQSPAMGSSWDQLLNDYFRKIRKVYSSSQSIDKKSEILKGLEGIIKSH